MRKVTLMTAALVGAVIVIGVIIYSTGASLANSRSVTLIPGTGVKVMLPDGIVVNPIGTMYTDENRQTILFVSSGTIERDLAKNPTMRALYPDPVEAFHSGSIDGVLYKRTRAVDGGTWDGWWLNVVKGDHVLAIKLSYSGSKPNEFEKLKGFLSTVSWDGTLGNPEVAFGLKLNVQGLELAHPGIGALLYTADGNADFNQRHLFAYSSPGNLHGKVAAFHQICEATATQMMAGKSHSPIRYETNGGITVCDTWGAMTHEGQDYDAALMLSDGSVILVTGLGDPDTFQHALLKAHQIIR